MHDDRGRVLTMQRVSDNQLMEAWTVQARHWRGGTSFGGALTMVMASSENAAITKVRHLAGHHDPPGSEYRAVRGHNPYRLPPWPREAQHG